MNILTIRCKHFTPSRDSTRINLFTNIKARPGGQAFILVELDENSLHPFIEELERWRSIIGSHYIEYELEKERNRLAYRP